MMMLVIIYENFGKTFKSKIILNIISYISGLIWLLIKSNLPSRNNKWSGWPCILYSCQSKAACYDDCSAQIWHNVSLDGRQHKLAGNGDARHDIFLLFIVCPWKKILITDNGHYDVHLCNYGCTCTTNGDHQGTKLPGLSRMLEWRCAWCCRLLVQSRGINTWSFACRIFIIEIPLHSPHCKQNVLESMINLHSVIFLVSSRCFFSCQINVTTVGLIQLQLLRFCGASWTKMMEKELIL